MKSRDPVTPFTIADCLGNSYRGSSCLGKQGTAMIRVRVDPARNRIELKVDQPVGEADMQRVVQELASGVKSMKPGWIMVSDFRGLTMVDPNLNPYIIKIQQTVRAASPRKIGVLFDDRLLDFQLRMGADTANSQDVTRRFTDEQEWLAYIEGP